MEWKTFAAVRLSILLALYKDFKKCYLEYTNVVILPYLEPLITGQAECRVFKFISPELCKLYHKSADPFFGVTVTLMIGKIVDPPESTSPS